MSEIKFSTTPPTKPGAYWWKPSENISPKLLEVYKHTPFGLCSDFGYRACRIVEIEGLWSPRLVPVDEVEKAYAEGFNMAEEYLLDNYNDCWNESRSKQVVEGEIVEEKEAK